MITTLSSTFALRTRAHAALVAVITGVVGVPAAHAGYFTDVTAAALGRETDDPATDGWSNKVVVADWGDGDPFVVRGRPRVWINDGSGHFVDESDRRLPQTKTGMSWDLTLIDADDDLDLDVLVSCKACTDGGIYLENQGDGTFL